MKEKAILAGAFIGELGWSILRCAPHVLWTKIKKYNNKVKLIVLCREQEFDLYGKHADILVPLKIKGDFTKYRPNCFRLDNYPVNVYEELNKSFYDRYKDKYNIIEHIYPKIAGKQFLQKNQYPKNQLYSKFKPRVDNRRLVFENISTKKPWIVISPRYRNGFKRNWKYWPELYDMIWNSDLPNKYEFIIIGRKPEYIEDTKKRFFDINNIPLTKNSSLIGLTISTVFNSILTVGSQSAIPNLSLLLSTEVLEWGNQKTLHSVTYNYTNTPITFIEDMNFNIEPEKIFKTMSKILKKKGNKNDQKIEM